MMPFGTLPLSAFAVGPRASAVYNPNEQALMSRGAGMMFRGFGGQLPRASDAFGFGQRQPIGTPPYNPGAPVGPDTPAPEMGSFNPTPAQGPTISAPGGYVDPAADPQTGFFQKNGMGVNILGAIADGVATGYGAPPVFGIAKQQNMQRQDAANAFRARAEQEEARRQQDRQWQVEDRDFKASQPEYFMSGNDRVRFDPSTGTAGVVYDGRSDAEDYAAALGLDPASADYRKAVQDYVLRGNGPTAFDYDRQLEGVRQGNRVSLRQMPTYAQANPRPAAPRSSGGGSPRAPTTLAGAVAPILAKMASGQPLTPAEQSAWNTYQGARGGGGARGGAGRATPPAGATKRARGPDGRMYEARGGQWVPVK